MISPNAHLASLPVYEPGRPIEEVARELGLDADAIIKLASNENAFGPSPKAVKAMRDVLKQNHLYPDGSGYELRQAIARKHGLKMEQVVLGNGSNEIIEFIGHAYLGFGDEMVISQYAFAIYELVARIFQASVVETPAREYGHDLAAMRQAITAKTRVIFVANPNNPTGTCVSASELEAFIRSVPDHVLVVIDEAYQEFQPSAPDTSRLIVEKPNLLVMHTFSKAQGLAGLRLGYGLASMEVAAALQKVRQPFNANLPAQAAGVAALEDEAHIARTVKRVASGRAFLQKAFARRKLRCVPSSANFVLVQVGNGREVFEKLLRHGVIVRPMQGYKLPEWIRVTVGTPSQNRCFLKALDAVMATF
ncbi:MAG: histidinol-phosphate transaminase [Verrucomicrobiae bacterium]|nr:histidinol-phosphate transaminase [Verrucomicrobiae bacterium]